MKKIYFSLIAVLILASCGKQDPAAQLKALKDQKAAIEAQIAELEKVVADADTTVKQGRVKDVIVTPVATEAFKHYLEIQGVVDADENVNLLPTMAGNITKINVNEGDIVKTGQVLAETDGEIYIRQIKSLEPQLALATDLYNRQQRLWDQKVGSEVQLLQAKTQKESLEKQLETLQEQLDMTRIKSPINGVVDYVGVKIGQFVAPGAMPAFRVVNMSKLKVKANVAEAYAPSVNKGNEAMIYIPDFGKEIKSKVSFVARVIDPLTRTFVTEVDLTGDNKELHPNMVAVLKITDYQNDNAITVPVNLIQNSETESFVFIAKEKDGKKIAHKAAVKVGKIYEGKAEILEGLAVNDLLITTGASDLAEGLELKY